EKAVVVDVMVEVTVAVGIEDACMDQYGCDQVLDKRINRKPLPHVEAFDGVL
ncbi:hypothetical protein PanWU01x14_297670, partial [Parasponia andersonii]